MMPDTERINHLEWRLKRLENFLGKSDRTKIIQTMNNLNERVLEHASNSHHARKLVHKVDEINRLTNSNFQRYLMGDRSANRELILADEERIRIITKNLSAVDTLARVLDRDCVQDIPKLYGSLNKLFLTHENLKSQHGELTYELSTFLQDYAAFTLLMDEKLQEYKSILSNHQQTS